MDRRKANITLGISKRFTALPRRRNSLTAFPRLHSTMRALQPGLYLFNIRLPQSFRQGVSVEWLLSSVGMALHLDIDVVRGALERAGGPSHGYESHACMLKGSTAACRWVGPEASGYGCIVIRLVLMAALGRRLKQGGS
jgi:hypothetical protein